MSSHTKTVGRLALLVVVALTAACAAPTAPPPEDTPEARLERALTLARMEIEGGALEATLDLGASLAYESSADTLGDQLDRELTADEAQQVEAVMRAALAEVLTTDAWTEAVAEVYAQHFTPAELDEAIAFFSSPTGGKVLQLQGAIHDEIGDATEAVLDARIEEFIASVDDGLAAAFPELGDEEGS